MSLPKTYKIVLILWVDSESDPDVWTDRDASHRWAKEGMKGNATVGLLLAKNKVSITVAMSVNETECMRVLKIPMSEVRSVKDLGKVTLDSLTDL